MGGLFGGAKPISPARRALAELAQTLEEAPWDDGFTRVADDLHSAQVRPAVEDLDENARDLGAFALMRHTVTTSSPWAAGGSMLAIGLAGASAIPDIAAAMVSIGAPVAAMAAATAAAVRERMRLNRVADHNRFMFLYQTEQDLRR